MKPLHGFFQDEKWYEDLGHIVLGLFPIGLLLWSREWTDWKLPWIFKGQWPPGDPSFLISRPRARKVEVTQLDRVSDVGRDELGYRIGATLRNVGLIVWWMLL